MFQSGDLFLGRLALGHQATLAGKERVAVYVLLGIEINESAHLAVQLGDLHSEFLHGRHGNGLGFLLVLVSHAT
ncbi:MAG TPA: hypothetical protein VNF51_02020 [Candidatus Paceibacterota bacterium]|nr:hypothetical protein [Candidatus Paceibacterota bacterium]